MSFGNTRKITVCTNLELGFTMSWMGKLTFEMCKDSNGHIGREHWQLGSL